MNDKATTGKKRFLWQIASGLIFCIVLFFQPLVSGYCWVTETPRTQFCFSSEMRAPIRSLFLRWQSPGDIGATDEARALGLLIAEELPAGATQADVNEHIERHFRPGVEVGKRNWLRSSPDGYRFPSLEVQVVRACWNPRDFLENRSVEINYVTLEGRYLRTEIRFVGWKGRPDSRVIKVIGVREREPEGTDDPGENSSAQGVGEDPRSDE